MQGGFIGIPGLWESQFAAGNNCLAFIDSDKFDLLTYYYNLYLTRYKYTKIPESIKKTMLDLSNMDRWLWYAPAVCFFKDDVLGLQVLPVTNNANFNVAYFPKEWTVYGSNGYSKSGLNYENSVLIFNDNARVPPINYVYKYVEKIVELEKTAGVNIDFQKNPFILEIDETQKNSAEKLFAKRSFWHKFILTRKTQKGGILEGLKVNQLKINYEADKYLATADTYENKILTYLGINNVQIEKAERLITSEANSNNEKTQAQYTAAFENRKKGFERVKELFGEEITIQANTLVKLNEEKANEEIDNTEEVKI